MKYFTGWQYLLIDIANNSPFDLDKECFEKRIEWAEAHLEELEQIAETHQWKHKPMFQKTTLAIRRAQRGEASGHLVGLDAVCSGMQLMACLTGCHSSAAATGLINPDARADAYTECTTLMGKLLGREMSMERKKVKNAVMTALYGSKAEPIKEFGEDTPELQAFYKAMYLLAPGPCNLLTALLDSWQPWVLKHEWILPDGFNAKVRVTQLVENRIEVDELNHASFTYQYYENMGEPRGVKNAANIIHSIDGYVLRCLVRRCNYDNRQARYIFDSIELELLERACGAEQQLEIHPDDTQFEYYLKQYERSGIADIVILPHLVGGNNGNLCNLSSPHLKALKRILQSMLTHPPFEIITVHDDFKCHPNYANFMRMHYRDILAELADSNLISDLLSQIHGQEGTYQKLSANLSDSIRNSNYALC